MKLSKVKEVLNTAESVNFKLPGGIYVPEHFHVTEIGVITKNFIDCGGTVREERVINFQLMDANDYEHRLKPAKLLKIISLSESILKIADGEIEVEYQNETIGKYGLDHDGMDFMLVAKSTACLANDNCGIPAEAITETNSCCAPGGGCC